jgi:hypothetical protein
LEGTDPQPVEMVAEYLQKISYTMLQETGQFRENRCTTSKVLCANDARF